MEEKAFFSVIIPTRSINKFITEENLPALESQTYRNFEVILLPNSQAPIDRELLNKYSWLKIIHTNKITRPAEKRDIGAAEAKGNILAFIDDDAYASDNWLEHAVRIFNEKTKVSNKPLSVVCGPGVLPPNAKFWEKVFDAVLCTWIGSGGFSYRFTPKPERTVDDFPSMNFLIKKKVFDKIGGFHSEYWPGEDSKLCEDVVQKLKGAIYYCPEVLVFHHRRNSLKHYLKQHGNYGYHRGAFFAHGDSNSRRFTYLVPSIFVIYLLLAIIYGFWLGLNETSVDRYATALIIVFIPLKIYKLAIGSVFLENSFKHKGIKVAFAASAVLVLMHIVYGTMFIKGLIIGTMKKESIY